MRDAAATFARLQPQLDGFELICPSCRAALEALAPSQWRCPLDGQQFGCVEGIWRFLPAARAAYYAPFLRDYTSIRAAEGYGYDDTAHYLRLPEVDAYDPLAWQWRMRARSFAVLRRRVVAPLARRAARRGEGRLRVLDLGAGIGWLSHRLAQLGCQPCAVDLNLDPRDGLGASRHYGGDWPRMQAEFDRLPLADAQADLLIYNASLPYSPDYRTTLAEALRVLRPHGRIVVIDSPIYQRDESGRQMIAERQAAFARSYGTRADALPSKGYLTWQMLRELGQSLGLGWQVMRPWYGWGWALRPWRARLAGKRAPSTFALLVARRVDSSALDRV